LKESGTAGFSSREELTKRPHAVAPNPLEFLQERHLAYTWSFQASGFLASTLGIAYLPRGRTRITLQENGVRSLLGLILVLIGLLPSQAYAQVPDQEAAVVSVVDGDTIDVQLSDGSTHRVRIIGIDTPETVAPNEPVGCWGPEASARTRELLLGATVWLERDTSETDRFGRLVRYVWLEDTLVEHILLAEGHATAFPFNPDTRRADEFAAIEAAAAASGVGMWGARVAAPVPEPAPPAPVAPAPSPPGLRPGFDPAQYVNQGNRYNCPDFQTQAEAQAVLRADPRDPNQARHRPGWHCV
jgi:micrococcal nuclease